MRLWSLHPRYLDSRGLVAVWREALLAQAVLKGQTRGYTHHPQLLRFRETTHPVQAIAGYLRAVYEEASKRGYQFDREKIGRFRGKEPDCIPVTRGQLGYEWDHLVAKIELRAPQWLALLKAPRRIESHPVFRVVPGAVETWEKTLL